MADETPNPLTPSSDYEAMKPYWDMVGAILCGAEAMRWTTASYERSQGGPAVPYGVLSQLNRGRTGPESAYLPKFENETPKDYDLRRRHAPFTNVYGDISNNLSSKPFSKELYLEEGAPAEFELLAENIDGQGNNLHCFARDTFKAGLDRGIDWISVEYTKVPPGVTLADERGMGARPYWVHIPADRLLALYTDFLNGQEVIYHARIHEPVTIVEGYTEVMKERVRVMRREPMAADSTGKVTAYGPAVWELWELVEDKEQTSWVMIDGGPITIGIIPLVPFITGKRKGSGWKIEPPLRDLAYLQVEEFQQESNLKCIKEMTAFPMLAGNGVTPPMDGAGEPMLVPVGPKATLFAPIGGNGEHGEWTFIEPTAASLTFLQADLEKCRTEMRALGMQPLSEASLTVVTTANLSAKATNSVQAWAYGLKDTLEQAWKITGMWMGQRAEVEVRVHTDFGVELEQGGELDALLKAQAQSILSKRTVQEELKRRGVLSDEFDADEEEELLASDQEGLMAEQSIDPITGRPLSAIPAPELMAERERDRQLAARSAA